MRALVTGGAGFLGSALTERLLAEGHEVDVVDDLSTGSISRLQVARAHGRSFRFHQLDICQDELPELIVRRRPEVVFNLGALTGEHRQRASVQHDAQVSVVGTLNVLEGARRAGTRKVVVTSDRSLARESASPEAMHDLAERAALGYLEHYRRAAGVEFSVLAFGCVYGPGHGDTGPVARLAAAVRSGTPAPLADEVAYDLVYLDDAVDALVRAATRGSGLVMEVSANCVRTAAELVAELRAISDGVRVTDAGAGSAGISRASLHLGWRPFTGLSDGLASLLRERDEQEIPLPSEVARR